MNKDQAKGRAKEVAGSIKKNVGEAIGNEKMESEGAILEAKGKTQRTVGELKQLITKSIEKV